MPDIITVAKGINSGYVPLGAMIARGEIVDQVRDRFFPGGLTYAGHPLACASAIASIEAFREEGIVENAAAMGECFREALGALQARHPSIGDVRGKGCFWGLELVKNRDTREMLVPFNAAGEAAAPVARMAKAALERGLYLMTHWNVVLVVPPLTVTREEAEEGIAVLDDVLSIADEYVARREVVEKAGDRCRRLLECIPEQCVPPVDDDDLEQGLRARLDVRRGDGRTAGTSGHRARATSVPAPLRTAAGRSPSRRTPRSRRTGSSGSASARRRDGTRMLAQFLLDALSRREMQGALDEAAVESFLERVVDALRAAGLRNEERRSPDRHGSLDRAARASRRARARAQRSRMRAGRRTNDRSMPPGSRPTLARIASTCSSMSQGGS